MRLHAVLILVTIALSVFLPFTGHIPLSPTEQGKCFISIDVCHTPGSSLPANADAPSLPEGPCRLLPAGIAEFMVTGNSSFASTSFPSQIEQPPRIFP
jgi:hypothetical protein